MTNLSYCVHAHFYQPPREDPLTGRIPHENGAAPYANWNERIHAECYRPNASLRNYEQISFNFGPTLLSWMQSYNPETIQEIVAQDRANVIRYGVGNAMAQAYNHTILPLASTRDKITQVGWGIADFEHRFGRRPQGMWLPEAAVDLETLDVLAVNGIQYTILAPWSAETEHLDPMEPYFVRLAGGRRMTVFFYHRELSGKISFDPGATTNADSFAQHYLASVFSKTKLRRGLPQLAVIASDGELYGHHQLRRERFLARLVDGAGSQAGLQVTYPARWLHDHPAQQEIWLRERTSWSCHHGVARWTGQCGCTPGDGHWKAWLFAAFERLAGELDGLYLEACQGLIADPWGLRNRYIHAILRDFSADEIIAQAAERPLTSEQARCLLYSLEAQRESQRMFTSCAFYFEDFDRIEPKNSVAYAAQAVRLARLATGVNLESQVVADLKGVASTKTGLRADQVFLGHLRRAEAGG